MEGEYDLVAPAVPCKLLGDLRGQDKDALDLLLIASDLEHELMSDLKEDINLLSEKIENASADECLVHPSCDLSSTSIITLASGRKDRFLEILRATHSHQKRETTNPSVLKKRITLMDCNGLTETLEFLDDKSYWRFVYCIKSIFANKLMTLRGYCTLTNSEIVKLSALDSHTVEYIISDTFLEIKVAKGESHILDITVMRALALSADFGDYMPINLDISQFHCRWMDMSGDKITELLTRASYKSKQFGSITSGDVIVSDESFISLLLPNDARTIIRLYVKYEKDTITLSSTDQDSAAVLGKLEVSLHAFFAASGGEGRITSTRRGSIGKDEEDRRRLDVLPLSLPIEIPLSSPDTDLVAKLIIYGATDLPGASRNAVPSAYCVVYLKGRDGSVIEAGRNKTPPIKSHDPEWNIEFFLHTRLGIAEIDSVLIKVKDASVGSLRTRHIGQVELPATVFVPSAAIARLHLPLMATERIITAGDAHNVSGQILVGTQIIKVPRAELSGGGRLSFISGADTSPSGQSTSGTISSRPLVTSTGSLPEDEIPQGGVANMRGVISRTPVSNVWWPCVSLASRTDSAAGVAGHSSGLEIDHGECLLYPTSFMIRSRTDSGYTRKGQSSAATCTAARYSQGEVAVRVPWAEVGDIII